ncbi:tetratricopeptide repeat protein [Corallococcus sp. CA053C]|uniref:tetratricopeptide repeat protein n=1 Tax=Corallococcus sp. CA053C TaxID=2316732 RepID=UPI001F3CBA46|nr:tetratricopeptide repeat protein [Corallococcus sp. CA053C]
MIRTRRFQLGVSAVVLLCSAAPSAWGQGTTPAKGSVTRPASGTPAAATTGETKAPATAPVSGRTQAPAAEAKAPASGGTQATTGEAKTPATASATPAQAPVPTAKSPSAAPAQAQVPAPDTKSPAAAQAPAPVAKEPTARPTEPAATRSGDLAEPQRPSQAALAASRVRDGDALMRERRYREAAFAFLDAKHAAPDHVEARFKLGNALAVLGYYGRAIEEWERASRLTQDAAIRQSAQDNVARARAKQAEAGTSPQALGQTPGSGPVADTTRAQARRAYEQGVQHISQRAYAAALQTLTQALQQEPLLTVAYIARGSANIGLRRYAEAAADYQFALKLEPESASPLYGLAEAYRALGRNLEAKSLYERYSRSTATDVRPELQEESRQKAERLR